MNPRPLLHLEGAAVLLASLFAYHWLHASWLQFAVLFLLPDLSMLGYLVNVRVGAIAYNAIHTYMGPLALAGYSFKTGRSMMLALSFIWIARFRPHAGIRIKISYPVQGHSSESSASST